MRGRIYIFTGPTLSAQEGRAELDATFLPPVAQGDVYRAALGKPVAIGIIDGYFERVPAVWHKEILWAMSEGIHVFGAASMGALRAVELAPFGMEGVGTIFESFQRGELEDDDEVAVAHGSAEDGYRLLSEPLVNLRATLAAARAAGVVGPATSAVLERVARDLFYMERAWPTVLTRAARESVPSVELEALRAWLPRGRVDQKRQDALTLLRTLRARLDAGLAPKQVRYHFEHTDAWEEVRRRASRLPLGGAEGEDVVPESLLDELRLRADLPGAWRAALARALAVEQAARLGRTVDEEELRRTAEVFRAEHGLLSAKDFTRWRRTQRVEDLERFLEEESHVRWVETLCATDAMRHLPDHLRATGEYGPLLERARDKERVLAANGLEHPLLADAGMTEAELWRWFFEQRRGQPVPEDLDHHARDSGFADVDALRRAVLRERCYARLR
ncbi:hypothetical protein D187_003606 [Cystobacter fuscus DSM 2262]|uniref:TfuA-like core domain-containing protein n=1 Tax=Cystobacter fuscus (strain ATCC 25194 / DSM 2262 / NBRC 100088 / M29) TaxID=1242864 RepID=S9P6T3_CYSF2|nr:TfuA-like protein [Cystobacter fuscus]EPX58891.1 hypothetical protein D187_003606 [Cystobacter fuscus DSM 2262]